MRIVWISNFLLAAVVILTTLFAASGFVPLPRAKQNTRISSSAEATLRRQQHDVTLNRILLGAASPNSEKTADDETPVHTESSNDCDASDNHVAVSVASTIADDGDDDDLSMPWSKQQAWALRDKMPHYIVHIPLAKDGKKIMTKCALWKTMCQDVTEIAGYPLDFLQEKYSKQVERDSKENGDENDDNIDTAPPIVLPYLDLFEFTSSGGALGNVYGVPGLADGTRIETSPVDKVQETLPKGYIRTVDGTAAYELGRPVPQLSDTAAGDVSTATVAAAATTGTLLRTVANTSAQSGKALMEAASDADEDADQMLVRLGSSTGILLAAAVAFNMLSHHLTVNVFWV